MVRTGATSGKRGIDSMTCRRGRTLADVAAPHHVQSMHFAIDSLHSIVLASQRVGPEGRGMLVPGMYADVVLSDPATIIDRATFEIPQQLSAGVRYVLVNGIAVVDQGAVTGARPGRALQGPCGTR
jgi:N-acyl-D-aspartate/D-glutamate deacylase